MSKFRSFLMVGAGVAALAAVAAAPAFAHAIRYHEMSVRAPDGTVEQIRYTGNIPPQISFEAQPVADGFASFFDMRPFAEMDRVAAAMDRQAADMMRMVDSADFFTMPSPQAIQASVRSLPSGAEGYSVVTVTQNGKTCTERMSYDYTSHGQPQIQKASYGDCASGAIDTNKPLKVRAETPVNHGLKHDWKLIEAAL